MSLVLPQPTAQAYLYPYAPESVSQVRARVRATYHRLDSDHLARVELAASELATNAVRHAAQPGECFALHCHAPDPRDGVVKVGVVDHSQDGPLFYALELVDTEEEGHRGLGMVQQMGSIVRWRLVDVGKVVEVLVPAAAKEIAW